MRHSGDQAERSLQRHGATLVDSNGLESAGRLALRVDEFQRALVNSPGMLVAVLAWPQLSTPQQPQMLCDDTAVAAAEAPHAAQNGHFELGVVRGQAGHGEVNT